LIFQPGLFFFEFYLVTIFRDFRGYCTTHNLFTLA
jgi:hypothetical protein